MRSAIVQPGFNCRPWFHLQSCSRSRGLAVPRTASTTTGSSAQLDLRRIDRKWQQHWEDAAKIARLSAQGSLVYPAEKKQRHEHGSPQAYILSMFPYPSGNLHMGHLRVYTIADVLARFKHMQGYEVLNPMAWDAFGLPAENAAIDRGVQPAKWTKDNIKKMKDQLISMNGGFDWSREFMTCDPDFYKHTQRIFLLLYERGLAYQAEALVNFDPVDRTVLANEQVDAHGFSWRSGAKVERVRLKQWFLRVTAFKEALLDDLDHLGKTNLWPQKVLTMQRNWLGKSEGAIIRFPIISNDPDPPLHRVIQVYTTRADTMFGAQYVALSLAHPLVMKLAESSGPLQEFLNKASSLPPDSKDGFLLHNVSVQNPLATLPRAPETVKERLPVFVAPYVLQEYGEGAVMGVPGHDIRDNEFWKLHRPSEPIRIVINPANVHGELKQENRFTALENNVFTDVGVLGPLCGALQGLSSKEAARKIVSDLASSCGLAEPASNWRIRDWLISRQRYWGTPIPIVHCQHCGAVPVPTEELPVELPKLDGSWFRQRSGNPLESAEDWLKTHCPKCSGPARRDTDTMDTFVDSSWYYMRFVDPHNMLQPFSTEKADSTLPVDIYIGGIEHAILHLLYARFISKFLATTPLWPSGGGLGNRAEPFKRLVTQGMVHGKTYSDPHTGRFLKPNEIDLSNPSKPKMVSTGETPNISWEKMSKSKHNGVDPSQPIKAYGADVTRAHMLFQAPIGQVLEWEEDRIVGIQRWFGKLWRIVLQMSSEAGDSSSGPHRAVIQSWDTMAEQEKQLWHLTQKTILSVTHSLSTSLALNTVISDLIKLTNALASPSIKNHNLLFHTTSILLRMLAPVGPAFAEECWERLHIHSTPQSIFNQPFPTPSSLGIQVKTTHQCAVQENGKLRLLVDILIAPQELLQANDPVQLQAWAVNQIQSTVEGNRWLLSKAGKDWKRVVVVKGGKTVNFVG